MDVFRGTWFHNAGGMRGAQSEGPLCAGLSLGLLLLMPEFHPQNPEQGLNWEGEGGETTSRTPRLVQQNEKDCFTVRQERDIPQRKLSSRKHFAEKRL